MTSELAENEILNTTDLTKRFGNLSAVDSVDLSIQEGEILSIIGPNGAGKTTLFNLLSGGLSPTSGTIRFKGDDITDDPPERRVHKGIARSFQINTLFESLTVWENVRLAVQARKTTEYGLFDSFVRPVDSFDDVNEATKTLVSQMDLEDQVDRQVHTLPYGDSRRLEIGLALATDPDLLLLDEPTAGMSTSDAKDVLALLRGLMGDTTLLLVEHDVEFVIDVSDRIAVLQRGCLIAEDSPDAIQQNEEVRKAYFGDDNEF